MIKYIFILSLFSTAVLGIRAYAAINTVPIEKIAGISVWALSVVVLIEVALRHITL